MNDMIMKYNTVPVITTKQLAEAYGTNNQVVSKNFNRNKNRFQEGKHYFLLKGNDLDAFRERINICDRQNGEHKVCGGQNDDCKICGIQDGDYKVCDIQDGDCKVCGRQNDHYKISNRTRILYLWTKRGALLLAKSIDTDTAWDAYERLIDFYFEKQEEEHILPQMEKQPLASEITDTPCLVSRTPLPETKDWYKRNQSRLDRICYNGKITKKQVIHILLKRAGEKYDLGAAKRIYREELGRPPQYALDVVSYFPELTEIADQLMEDMERIIEMNKEQ